jgi:cell division protein ZapA
MEDTLKIKISLADRVYPLTVKRSEEESIRRAAKSITSILNKYEEGYAVRDKQDLLAMCALQLASRLDKIQTTDLVDGNLVGDKIQELYDKMAAALDSN